MNNHSDEYLSYMGSPAWNEKREQVIDRSGGNCERCGDHFGRYLQVHHLSYDNLGNEPLGDLEALCEDCHNEADQERDEETAERLKEWAEERWENSWRSWADRWYGENAYDDAEAEDAFICYVIDKDGVADLPEHVRPRLLWWRATKRSTEEDHSLVVTGSPLYRDQQTVTPTKVDSYEHCPLRFYYSHWEEPPKMCQPLSMDLAYAQIFKEIINRHLKNYAKEHQGKLEGIPGVKREELSKEVERRCYVRKPSASRFSQDEIEIKTGFRHYGGHDSHCYITQQPMNHIGGFNGVLASVLSKHELVDTARFIEVQLQGCRYRSVVDTITMDSRGALHFWMWSTARHSKSRFQKREPLSDRARRVMAYAWGVSAYKGYTIRVNVCRPHDGKGTALSYPEQDIVSVRLELESLIEEIRTANTYPAKVGKLCNWCTWQGICEEFKKSSA